VWLFPVTLPLGDTASITAFAAAFNKKFKKLDILVNNAGWGLRRCPWSTTGGQRCTNLRP